MKQNLWPFSSSSKRTPAKEKPGDFYAEGIGSFPTKAKALAAAKKEANETGKRVEVRWKEGYHSYQTFVLPTPAAKKRIARESRPAPEPKRALSAGSYRGYKITAAPEGHYFTSLEPASWFDSQKEARAFIDSWIKGRGNPSLFHTYQAGGLTFSSLGKARDYAKRESKRGGVQPVISKPDDKIVAMYEAGLPILNPAKFDRCVKEVQAKGGAGNAYAVCTAAGTRPGRRGNPRPGVLHLGDRVLFRGEAATILNVYSPDRRGHGETILIRTDSGKQYEIAPQAVKKIRKRNPASSAVSAYEEFHGHAPDETVEVRKEIHFHGHLTGLGELMGLTVRGVDYKETNRVVHLAEFEGALLCCDEKMSQLFIEGGNQAVDLKAFGIKGRYGRPAASWHHETETLGKVVAIEYHTRKDHLGDEGGEATYEHQFRTTNKDGEHVVVKIARYPDLIYWPRDEQLGISGGSYEIRAEGIDK